MIDEGVHTFPKYISLKVNVITQLKFELAFYDSTIEFVSYIMWTSLRNLEDIFSSLVLNNQIWFIAIYTSHFTLESLR